MNKDAQIKEPGTGAREISSGTISNLLIENCWETLSEFSDLFFKSLKLGRVRGIVCIVDVPNSGSDIFSENLQTIQELIRRDILVTLSSCDAANINKEDVNFFQKAGYGLAEFCNFIGIQPVLYTATTDDPSSCLAFYKGLADRVAINTSDLPVAVIASGTYENLREGLGALFVLDHDPVKTVDLVDDHIHDKRLSVQWCDRCGGRFSAFS